MKMVGGQVTRMYKDRLVRKTVLSWVFKAYPKVSPLEILGKLSRKSYATVYG